MVSGTKTTDPTNEKRIIDHETEGNGAMKEKEQQETEGNKSKEQIDEEEEQIGKIRKKKWKTIRTTQNVRISATHLRLLTTHNPLHPQTLK
ncbi:hypothetical protein HHI36_000009 [Cryptolaemus montrouzieri]|uniref:Uncharacterized protein n=1 Tax=Cryptolaemus montrouzieri TaxID=559131 RepID=A0ABD2P426_9CUCU